MRFSNRPKASKSAWIPRAAEACHERMKGDVRYRFVLDLKTL
jgi:hypothetical protein